MCSVPPRVKFRETLFKGCGLGEGKGQGSGVTSQQAFGGPRCAFPSRCCLLLFILGRHWRPGSVNPEGRKALEWWLSTEAVVFPGGHFGNVRAVRGGRYRHTLSQIAPASCRAQNRSAKQNGPASHRTVNQPHRDICGHKCWQNGLTQVPWPVKELAEEAKGSP